MKKSRFLLDATWPPLPCRRQGIQIACLLPSRLEQPLTCHWSFSNFSRKSLLSHLHLVTIVKTVDCQSNIPFVNEAYNRLALMKKATRPYGTPSIPLTNSTLPYWCLSCEFMHSDSLAGLLLIC